MSCHQTPLKAGSTPLGPDPLSLSKASQVSSLSCGTTHQLAPFSLLPQTCCHLCPGEPVLLQAPAHLLCCIQCCLCLGVVVILQVGGGQAGCSLHSTAQHSTAQHSTAQHSTARHGGKGAGQHSMIPYPDSQFCTKGRRVWQAHQL